MRTTSGEVRLQVQAGKREAEVWARHIGDGWLWSAHRDFGQMDRVAKAGKAKTWAAAYRSGMRAAERLLARATP